MSKTTRQEEANDTVDEARENTEAVVRVVEALSGARTMNEVIAGALEAVRVSFGWIYGSFWELDDLEKSLRFSQESGSVNEQFQQATAQTRYREGVGLSGRAWRERRLIAVDNLGDSGDCSRTTAARMADVQSGICFPLFVGDKMIGTMDFFVFEKIQLTAGRLDALRGVANLIDSALARVAELERSSGLLEDARAVARVLMALESAHSRQKVLSSALEEVRAAFGWVYGSFWQLDEQSRVLRFALESGTVNEDFRRVTAAAEFAEGIGLSGRAWRRRELVFVEDLGTLDDCCRAPVAQGAGVKSGVCFPILEGQRIVGTMDFFVLQKMTLSEERLAALRNIASLVGSALSRRAEQDRISSGALDTEAVTQVLSQLESTRDEREAAQMALAAVRSSFEWTYGSYWTVEGDKLQFQDEAGTISPEFSRMAAATEYPRGQGMGGQTWFQREAVVVRDLGELKDCPLAPLAQRFSLRAGVSVPITVGAEVVATLDFWVKDPQKLGSSRLAALKNIAAVVSLVTSAHRQRLGVLEQARAVKEVSKVLSALAEGNLDMPMEGNFAGKLADLEDVLETSIENLRALVKDSREAALSVSRTASEIAQGNISLSQRTEEQAASLEKTAATMEELTVTVRQNAKGAMQVAESASLARERALEGGKVAQGAVKAMVDIKASSKKIADIISVIDEIAFQTNLLALNAAIEAARAGDQGRGFAVVASEVRNLAGRSASAAKEIKALISDSVEKVDHGGELVARSEAALDQIVESVTRVNDLVADIAAASQQQSIALEQVNESLLQLDQVTQQNAALVEESAAAAESMDEQAQNLETRMRSFQLPEDSPYATRIMPAVPAKRTMPEGTPAFNQRHRPRQENGNEDWEDF
jgi:methyl-accepting chemotaxis protein